MSQRYLNEDTSDLASEREEIKGKVEAFFREVVKPRLTDMNSCKCLESPKIFLFAPAFLTQASFVLILQMPLIFT